jgi:outer membrane protein assembly factor BamB
MRLIRCLVALIAFAAGAAALHSADNDWPQWRGPDRTGVSTEKGLLKEWPKDGPKLAWKITGLGAGYSTPSVANGRVFVMGTKGEKGAQEDLLIALNVKDGSRAWTASAGATERAGYPGPRCTPTVDGNRVYAIGSRGRLVCADASSGAVVWQKEFQKEFGGRHGAWAYAESPLIDGDVLVCTPGGTEAPLVALKKATGDVIWKAEVKGLPAGKKGGGYTTAGYSSVIVAQSGGVKQYVQFLAGGVVGVDATTGKLLWHYDEPANGTANFSTPIFRVDSVFAASAYNTGGGRAKIVKDGDGFKAEPLYFLTQLQNHHGGLVLVGDHVYGTGGGDLFCIEFKTGKVAWKNKSAGKGSVVYADGHLYVRGESGTVALVEANPEKYVEKGRFSQPDRSKEAAWPHPVVSGGKLYLHDQDVLLCYDVKAK